MGEQDQAAELDPLERIAASMEQLAKDSRASTSLHLWDDLHTVERRHTNVRRSALLLALLFGLLIGAALAERAAQQERSRP